MKKMSMIGLFICLACFGLTDAMAGITVGLAYHARYITLGAELITNSTCEAAAATLDEDSTFRATYAKSADRGYDSSANSAKISKNYVGTAGAFTADFKDSDASKVTSGKIYMASAWYYLPSGQNMQEVRMDMNGNAPSSLSWGTQDAWTFIRFIWKSQGSDDLGFSGLLGNNTEYFYIDDVSIKEIIKAYSKRDRHRLGMN